MKFKLKFNIKEIIIFFIAILIVYGLFKSSLFLRNNYLKISGLLSISKIFNMENENESLKKENLALKIENSKLKDANSLIFNKIQSLDEASILLYINNRQGKFILIDKGCSKNFQINSIVLSENLLVGRITQCNMIYSKVELISNDNFKISIKSLSSNIDGLMEIKNGNYYITLTDNNKKISDKELIVSSGKDGIFSNGLVIGEYEANKNSLLPLLDINKINEVKVLNLTNG